MTKRSLPSVYLLKQLIDYNPDTGKLYWKERPEEMFEHKYHPRSTNCKRWNTRYAGKEAFIAIKGLHYYGGSVMNKQLLAHRVAWAIHSGDWPEDEIDHINGDKLDNRITNLRPAVRSENESNKPPSSRNTSGTKGVDWHKRTGTWRVRVSANGKHYSFGYHKSLEEAIAVRNAAAEKLHGEFVRHA